MTPKTFKLPRGQVSCWVYLCDGMPTHAGWWRGSLLGPIEPIGVCAWHAGCRFGSIPRAWRPPSPPPVPVAWGARRPTVAAEPAEGADQPDTSSDLDAI